MYTSEKVTKSEVGFRVTTSSKLRNLS